jgi:hypothetical protein
MAGRAEREPGNVGQQIATAPGDLSQLRRSGGVLGVGQPAPPGVPDGDARQVSAEQPVAIGLATIACHLTEIELIYDNRKLAGLVSAR